MCAVCKKEMDPPRLLVTTNNGLTLTGVCQSCYDNLPENYQKYERGKIWGLEQYTEMKDEKTNS